MENSFFEYRDKTGVASGSDSDYIEDSIVEDQVFSCKKKNHTAFVAESDESISNDESMTQEPNRNVRKSVVGRTSASMEHVISNSEDDGSRRGSIRRRRSSESQNNVVVTSSDEEAEELSPELLPKRRPPQRPKSIVSNDSLILHRTKKRMLFQDSDTDNSIILEHDRNKKHLCLKQTPLKIVSDKKIVSDDESMVYDNESDDNDNITNDDSQIYNENDSQSEEDIGNRRKDAGITKKCKKMAISSDESTEENEEHSKGDEIVEKCHNAVQDTVNDLEIVDNDISSKATNKHEDSSKNDDVSVGQETDDDDDGPDEDMMAMSRATRMSIMGVIPKDNDSDESDYIHSDSSSRISKTSIGGSLENLPEVTIHNTPEKDIGSSIEDLPEVTIQGTPEKLVLSDDGLPEVSIYESTKVRKSNEDLPEVSLHKTLNSLASDDDDDGSRISCSPFSSPVHNNSFDKEKNGPKKVSRNLNANSKVTDYMDLTINTPTSKPKDWSKVGVIDLSNVDSYDAKNKVLDKSASVLTKKAVVDDDVTIIDREPEIIALSSDDEDDLKSEKKSTRLSKSPKPKKEKSPRASKSHDDKENDQNIINIDQDYVRSEGTIKPYLVPQSHPSKVLYVSKQVREIELEKLNRLKEDLTTVRKVLQEMDMDSLPDGGSRLIQRLTDLEKQVRAQGDTVASMVVELDEPLSADKAKDGFGSGLTWDELQKASNAVQPRMFGKQAMATHMAERSLIISRLRDLHESLGSRPAETTLATAPRLLRSELMPHQRHALVWLQWRETQRPCAGILADDMGLGKTVTMISLIAGDKESNIDHGDDDEDESTGRSKLTRGGTLVVCPASLIQQWANEVTKHCTSHGMSVCLHHGAARATQPHRLHTYDIVATTYNILQRDNEKNGVLMRIQWRRIILDEAHIVRNHKSATSVAVCNLKGKRRWCLTGTPVQNKDLDLFALLKFLRCSPFDDLQMWKKWINNKTEGGHERLSTIMRCILLRRTKQQLQQKGQLTCLPTKSQHISLVTLQKDEMNVYQKVLVLSKTLFAQFLHQRAEKNSNVTSFAAPGKDSEYAKMHKKMVALHGVAPVKSHEILVLLLRLRQVCCHCGLIAGMLDEATADAPPDPASSDLLKELDKLSLEDKDRRKSTNPDQEDDGQEPEATKADEAIRAVLAPNNPVFQLNRSSSKISAVMDCLRDVFSNKGDKAVVVSQWTSVLRLVEAELAKQKIRSVTLSGNVPVPARSNLIALLNDPKSDVKVMLLSLCAGGVGINLCGANHLLLLDPHWNPQLEEQAQDRIYRVGQNKDVHIYRFLCVDTVEQTIRKLQEAKLQMADNVLTGARNSAASTLSIEDLKMLFNMKT